MSATITLQTGDYYIQAHDEPRRFIGVDTRSRLYPRALVALPDGHQPLWHIQNLDDVRYVIKIHNLASIIDGDTVVAQPTQIPHQWIVQHVPTEGQFTFVILNNYPGDQEDTVWALENNDPFTEVKLNKVKWHGLRLPLGLPNGYLFNILPLVTRASTAVISQPKGGVLRNGKYLIKKHGLNGGYIAIDNGPISPAKEDRKVFVLPHGVRAPVWRITQHLDSGIYTISSEQWDALTGQDGVVGIFSPLIPWQWSLQAFPLQGINTWSIYSGHPHDNQGPLGWTLDSTKPYTQVGLKRSGVFIPEDPPQDQLFDLIPVPDELGELSAAPAPVVDEDIVVDLPAGQYFVKKHDSHDGYLAVKKSEEELSPVVVLPGGTEAPKWNFTAPNTGRYEISSEGQDTQAKDNLVVAGGFSIQQGRWIVRRFPLLGKDVYIIVDETNTGNAWAVTKPDAYTPVELREIGVFAPELPPKDLLFDIIPVPQKDRDDVKQVVTLPRGEYLIKKHGSDDNYLAIKSGHESVRPVITLAKGIQGPRWSVGTVTPNQYLIASSGDETFSVGNQVLTGEVSTLQGNWFLHHHPQQGRNTYTIVSIIDPSKAWASAGADTPVKLREIGVFIPEQPPRDLLFDFIPVRQD